MLVRLTLALILSGILTLGLASPVVQASCATMSHNAETAYADEDHTMPMEPPAGCCSGCPPPPHHMTNTCCAQSSEQTCQDKETEHNNSTSPPVACSCCRQHDVSVDFVHSPDLTTCQQQPYTDHRTIVPEYTDYPGDYANLPLFIMDWCCLRL